MPGSAPRLPCRCLAQRRQDLGRGRVEERVLLVAAELLRHERVAEVHHRLSQAPRPGRRILSDCSHSDGTLEPMTTARRWWIVAIGVLALLAAPLLVHALPVEDSAESATSLAARIQQSHDVPYSGSAE